MKHGYDYSKHSTDVLCKEFWICDRALSSGAAGWTRLGIKAKYDALHAELKRRNVSLHAAEGSP